jgi:hypothetical protein
VEGDQGVSAALPTLSARDLEDELGRIHARKHRALTTAFYGVPELGLERVTVTVKGEPVRFCVAQATCELEVRRALAGARGEPVVVLVGYSERLPLDITGRLAGGKVRHITEAERLARLTGARAVSTEVLASALKDAILADGVSPGALSGSTLDLDTAWRRYLEHMIGLIASAPLTEERVVAHVAQARDMRGFARLLAARPALAEELHEYLERRSGRVARLAWRAWERGQGLEVAAMALILQAAREELERSEYLAGWLGLRLSDLDPELQGVLGRRSEADRGAALIRRWGEVGAQLFRYFDDDGFERVVKAADRLVAGDERIRAALASSPHLAVALDGAKDALAAALEQAAAAPTTAALAQVHRAKERLAAHRLCEREPHKSQLGRVRMAVRLCGYLFEQAAARHEPAGLAADEVADLAAAYARDGGFVDWARSAARGPLADRLDRAIAGVVTRVDDMRDRLDERFARALPGWLGRRKADRVVPIDRALERFAVEFLAGGAHRRLLVLLLDGMSWANAAELLDALENERYGPVRWQPRDARGELLPPMLAALPTLTGVSRSAFFAGKLVPPGQRTDTRRDPDRFDEHAGLRKLLGRGPRLLLSPDAEDRPGHVSSKALELIGSSERVVGLVINAIDDNLASGPGLRSTFTPDTLKALPDVLAAATQAQRAVLLVADHGHVLSERAGAALPCKNKLSARCRELEPDEEPGPGEIVLDGDGAWRGRAKSRLALLYREVDTYAVPGHRGEHGGAALAEVVAPAVLMASEELLRSVGVRDAELDLRPVPRPWWWVRDVPVVEQGAGAALEAREGEVRDIESRVSQAAPRPQLALPGMAGERVEAEERAPVAAARPEGRAVELLRASDEYANATRAERDVWERDVLPAVALLAEQGGIMSDDQLAARLGILRFRVPGLVANILALRLNLEQHPVVIYDSRSRQVRLDLVLLEQLFGG